MGKVFEIDMITKTDIIGDSEREGHILRGLEL